MAQTKHQIQALLAEVDASPRRRFGQNFMIDQNLVRLVAEAGEIASSDCVIEVGPGTGTLTEELVTRAGKVVVVEIDRNLASLVRQRFESNPNFAIIEGDALAGKHQLNAQLVEAIQRYKGDGGSVKLVANLPYNIASPLVIEMLIAGVELLAFTVQREVAQRLGAAPGSDDYGPLSVMAQLLAKVEVLRTLPPQAFWPSPQVESALVRLRRDDRLGAESGPVGVFVHAIFSYRRKTLRKALTEAGYDGIETLAAAGLVGSRRPEEFAPGDFVSLFKAARTNREFTKGE